MFAAFTTFPASGFPCIYMKGQEGVFPSMLGFSSMHVE